MGCASWSLWNRRRTTRAMRESRGARVTHVRAGLPEDFCRSPKNSYQTFFENLWEKPRFAYKYAGNVVKTNGYARLGGLS